MKTIDKLSFVPLLALLLFAGSCEKDGGVFMRENDAIACDCTEQSISQNVLCDGEWVADCGDVGWIAITPERGSGNGKDYGFFTLNIQYNSGAERTATVHLVYDGAAYPITVTQGRVRVRLRRAARRGQSLPEYREHGHAPSALRLRFGTRVGRNFLHDHRCGGRRTLGDETGLHRIRQRFGRVDDSRRGGGDACGCRGVRTLRRRRVGRELPRQCHQRSRRRARRAPGGVEFLCARHDGTAPRGSEWDYSWTTDAIHPATDTNPLDAHRLLPTAGNENAYLTASGVVSDNGNYTFNPGIQIKGLMENDYFLFVIPVRNIKAEHKLSVEASMGAAGSGPGYYALEYSADNKTWMLAEGSTLMEVFGTSAQVHYYVPKENTSGDRKTYDKSTDKGYRKYVFPLTGMETIYEGNLYLRLRICMDRRANGSESTNTIASAWPT